MARYLTAALLATVLLVALVSLRDPALPPQSTAAIDLPADSLPSTEVGALSGIEAKAVQRSLSIDRCLPADEEESYEVRRARFKRQQEAMYRVLKASADAEHLMVAALVSRDERPGQAARLMRMAADLEPGNPLIAAQLLEMCIDTRSCSSDPQRLEWGLIRADRANAMAWVQVARSTMLRGDERGALQALREAVAAATLEDAYVDYYRVFDRAIAASLDLSTVARASAAGDHSTAAVPANNFLITQHCNEFGQVPGEWNHLCLRLGERLEQDGRSMLQQETGLSLQAKMHEHAGDTRAQQAALQRRQELRDRWSDLVSRSPVEEMPFDSAHHRRFLDILGSQGEFAAMEYAIEIAETLRTVSLAEGVKDCAAP